MNLKRLRQMSRDEITQRMHEQIRRKADFVRFRTGLGPRTLPPSAFPYRNARPVVSFPELTPLQDLKSGARPQATSRPETACGARAQAASRPETASAGVWASQLPGRRPERTGSGTGPPVKLT